MRENKGKLEQMLQELQIKEKNCNREIKNCPEGRLYLGKSHGRDCYYHATKSDGGDFKKPRRKAINIDSDIAKALAHKKFLEELQKYLQADISLLRNILTRMDSWDVETILQKLPRAYRGLPEEHFLFGTHMRHSPQIQTAHAPQGRTATPGRKATLLSQPTEMHNRSATGQPGGWRRMDSGILVPERLITAARQGTLTKKQKEEIREIQREWASMDYEINTKNPEQKNKITSQGLMTRSLSEVSIIERLYNRDIPFRYDQVILIGTKEVSPDMSFLSITRGVIWWEHCGMTHSDSYVEYHRFKRKLYESAGIVPWENYIETYNEEDGFLDIRMIDAIIENTLLRWLHLD